MGVNWRNDDADRSYFEYEAQQAEDRFRKFVLATVGVGLGAVLGTLLLLWEGVRDLDLLLRVGVVGGGVFGGFLGFFTAHFHHSHPFLRRWLPPTCAALVSGLVLHRYGVVEGWTAVAVGLGGLLAWLFWQYEEGQT